MFISEWIMDPSIFEVKVSLNEIYAAVDVHKRGILMSIFLDNWKMIKMMIKNNFGEC